MESVGLYLQKEAVTRSDLTEKDHFGRSSYTRYYYATFLLVRDMFRAMNPDWARVGHADYPPILDATIYRRLEKDRYRALRIKDYELANEIGRAKVSCKELAALMRKGYAIRVTADYFPEVQIDFFSGERFKLNSVSINDAHDWPARARLHSLKILNAWKQLND
jgi:hypothetical protein